MADRNGYIGRAPSDSSVTVARQNFSPTGVQTNFTFASGYTPGYLDAYLNGVKLVVAQDFTATDGSVVGLTTAAASGDILELVAFKAFNATSVSNAGTLSVSGNQTNDGTLSVTGGTTLSNLNVTGILTAGSLSGDGSALTGVASTDFIITGTAATFNNTTELQNVQLVGVTTGLNVSGVATFAGSVSIGGTLTYEDVTNIDSVGIITARSDVSIADKIIHTGDTNTAIRFPAADTFTVETGGSEALRVDSSQRLLVGTTSQSGTANQASIHSAGKNTLSIIDTTSYASGVGGAINLGGNYRSSGDAQAFVRISAVKENGTDNNYSYGMQFDTTANGGSNFGTSAMRLDSSGRLGIGTDSPSESLEVAGNGLKVSGQSSSITDEGISFDWDSGNNNGRIFSESAASSNLLFYTTNSGTRAEALRITSAGQVSISSDGTADGLLTIKGDSDATGTPSIRLLDGSDSREVSLSNESGDFIVSTHGTDNNAHGQIKLFESGIITLLNGGASGSLTERLRIDSDGRLMLNTTTEGYAGAETFTIEDSGNAGITIRTGTSQNGTIAFSDATSGDAEYDGYIQYSQASQELRFATDSTSRVRIDSNGHLEVDYDSSNDARVQFGYTTGIWITGNSSDGHQRFYTNSAERIRSGYNGQGTEFSNQNSVRPGADNSIDLGSGSYRYDDIYATNGTINTSDSRLKREVETSVLGIDFVKALRPVSYKWIEGKKVPIVDSVDENGDNVYRSDDDNNWVYESRAGGRKHWGFIAQEVKQAVDDAGVDFAGWTLADKDDPDSTQSLRYEEFIAPLTKALQEAIAKIETLETNNAALTARVAALEA